MTKNTSEAKTSFTPGPWGYTQNYVSAGNAVICEIHHLERPFEENRANARLIAAAPELLYALKAAQRYGTFPAEVSDLLADALKKAEGRECL